MHAAHYRGDDCTCTDDYVMKCVKNTLERKKLPPILWRKNAFLSAKQTSMLNLFETWIATHGPIV